MLVVVHTSDGDCTKQMRKQRRRDKREGIWATRLEGNTGTGICVESARSVMYAYVYEYIRITCT